MYFQQTQRPETETSSIKFVVNDVQVQQNNKSIKNNLEIIKDVIISWSITFSTWHYDYRHAIKRQDF